VGGGRKLLKYICRGKGIIDFPGSKNVPIFMNNGTVIRKMERVLVGVINTGTVP
jgi:hypothetical protein